MAVNAGVQPLNSCCCISWFHHLAEDLTQPFLLGVVVVRIVRVAMVLKPSTEMVQVQSKLSLKAPVQVLTRGMLASLPEMGWVRESLILNPGQIFCTTGPASRKTDTPIRRAQAHPEKLGLQYVKVNSFSKKSPPDFLLSTSLELENTKMRQARERRIPIVLIEQVHQLETLERPIVAWLSSSE